jgi:hypothetical protein
MGVYAGPDIREDGLVLALDAADPNNYNLTAVEVLVVAGGGGGGTHHGGGGGAGGLIYNSNFSVTPGSAVTVTVGDGGSGGTYSPNANGSNGGNSVFGSLTAIGGGGGGTYANNGNSGGSGGGANNWSTSATGGSATSGQGFSGASNNGQTNYGGGGGGAGGTAKGLSNNSGGDGLYFSQFASIGGSPAGWFAGGGAAGVYPGYTNDTSYGTGGLGGGGNGGNGPHGSGTGKTNGTTNTGGGGGSSADLYQNGASGGSGIVIVRYPGPQRAIGGTVTSSGGYTIHTFTTVETTSFTPLAATNNSTILGLADFSGNNNFGTTANSPTYSSANGGYITFDGSNDYIDCGNSSSLTITDNITVSIWVRRTSYNSNIAMLIRRNSYDSYAFQLGSSSPTIRWKINTGPSTWAQTGTTALNLNEWANIVGTYDKSTMRLYKNGVQMQTLSETASINYPVSDNLIIGRDDPVSGRYFIGNIAQVQIYNRALTASEIQQNFNASRGRFGI